MLYSICVSFSARGFLEVLTRFETNCGKSMIPFHAIWSMSLCWCNYFTSFWGWILTCIRGKLKNPVCFSQAVFVDGSQHLFALQVDAERAKRGVTVLEFSSAVCISGFHASIFETEGCQSNWKIP